MYTKIAFVMIYAAALKQKQHAPIGICIIAYYESDPFTAIRNPKAIGTVVGREALLI